MLIPTDTVVVTSTGTGTDTGVDTCIDTGPDTVIVTGKRTGTDTGLVTGTDKETPPREHPQLQILAQPPSTGTHRLAFP